LSVASSTQPAHGTVTVKANGGYTYTPHAHYCGTDSFNYTLSDGQATDTATVTVSITAVQDAPLAANDAYTVPEDTLLTVPAPGVLANDTDADGDCPLRHLR